MKDSPEDALDARITNILHDPKKIDAFIDEQTTVIVNEALQRGINVTAALASMDRWEAIPIAQKAGMSEERSKTATKSSDNKAGLAHFIATEAIKEGYFDTLEAQVNAKLEEKKSQSKGISV
jgi:hypothetical protein